MRIRLLIAGAAALAVVAVLAATAGGAGESKKTLFAVLSGGKAQDKGDPDGFGSFAGSVKSGKICFGLTVQGIAKPAAAHIHRGKAGVGGAIVIPLKAPSSGNGATSGCVKAATALLAEINKSPSGFYVNVHTGDFPTGAIRGQLFHASSSQDR